jgi:hypothetical protein
MLDGGVPPLRRSLGILEGGRCILLVERCTLWRMFHFGHLFMPSHMTFE